MDRGAGFQQFFVQQLLFCKRHTINRRNHQGRPATRNQGDNGVLWPKPLNGLKDTPRGNDAIVVRHRVPSLKDFNFAAGHAVFIARHHNALHRHIRPKVFQLGGHGCRRFASANNHTFPARLVRKIIKQALLRHRCRNGTFEHSGQ